MQNLIQAFPVLFGKRVVAIAQLQSLGQKTQPYQEYGLVTQWLVRGTQGWALLHFIEKHT